MMSRFGAFVVGLVAAILPGASGQEVENPFKKAVIGDYAKYSVSVSQGKNQFQDSMTITVKEKTATLCKLVIETNVMGNKQSQDQLIDLTKPFDNTAIANQGQKGTDIKKEKINDGKEKLKVGTREFDTTWEANKVTTQSGDPTRPQEFKGTMKQWIAKDFPFGVIKSESSFEVQGVKIEMKMELIEVGQKK